MDHIAALKQDFASSQHEPIVGVDDRGGLTASELDPAIDKRCRLASNKDLVQLPELSKTQYAPE